MRMIRTCAVCIAVLLYAAPGFAHSPKAAMSETLSQDPRNAGLKMSAYWASYLSSDAIVVSIDEIPEAKAPVDILRVLYQFAAKMEDER
jgi:hypothetical protein